MNAIEFKKRRKELKLSQREVAEKIGVTQASVSGYESDRMQPGEKIMARFLKLRPQARRTQIAKAKKGKAKPKASLSISAIITKNRAKAMRIADKIQKKLAAKRNSKKTA